MSAHFTAAADGSVGFVLGEYDRSRVLTIDPVIEYSTYLGGSIFDIAWSLAVDAAGHAYIAGYAASSNFPTLNAYQPRPAGQGDAFVAKFNPDGTPAYSTYLGGSYVDWATDIAVDAQGNAYVLGRTGSVNFPTVMAFQPNDAGFWDAFVTKLNPTGSALVYSTYLGGSGDENYTNAGDPGGIAVDSAGSAGPVRGLLRREVQPPHQQAAVLHLLRRQRRARGVWQHGDRPRRQRKRLHHGRHRGHGLPDQEPVPGRAPRQLRRLPDPERLQVRYQHRGWWPRKRHGLGAKR